MSTMSTARARQLARELAGVDPEEPHAVRGQLFGALTDELLVYISGAPHYYLPPRSDDDIWWGWSVTRSAIEAGEAWIRRERGARRRS